VLSQDLAQSARSRAIRRQIQIAGKTAVYFEYPAIDGSNRNLIMIHGYRGNHHGLEAIAAGLSKYRVIIPDLPGFGQSDPLETTHSVEAYSNWIRDFVHGLSLGGEINLIGHSFGTLVVGHYAINHNLKSAVLINPVSTPALEGPQATLTSLTKIYYSLAGLLPKSLGLWLLRNKLAVMVMSVVMAKTKNRALRKWIHRQHLDNFSDFKTIAVATEGYEASISTDLSQLASLIKVPVLVIAAEFDDITSIASQRAVAKLYSSVNYQEIQGVGHLVHYEAPDQAASHITNFLESQP
jgi:pimeloyl-ACP methyl ester carboxylesterase